MRTVTSIRDLIKLEEDGYTVEDQMKWEYWASYCLHRQVILNDAPISQGRVKTINMILILGRTLKQL